MFIPDPTFFHHGSWIRTVSIPHPGPASKNLSILTKKNGFYALENMIRVVHPGSGCWLSTHPGSRIPGVKKAPDPGSRIQIRNTGKKHAEEGIRKARNIFVEEMSTRGLSVLAVVAMLQQSLVQYRTAHYTVWEVSTPEKRHSTS